MSIAHVGCCFIGASAGSWARTVPYVQALMHPEAVWEIMGPVAHVRRAVVVVASVPVRGWHGACGLLDAHPKPVGELVRRDRHHRLVQPPVWLGLLMARRCPANPTGPALVALGRGRRADRGHRGLGRDFRDGDPWPAAHVAAVVAPGVWVFNLCRFLSALSGVPRRAAAWAWLACPAVAGPGGGRGGGCDGLVGA